MKQNETGENWWRVPVPNGSERHVKAASFAIAGDGLSMLGP
jgi:predicted RNA-binding protein with TRAM domain